MEAVTGRSFEAQPVRLPDHMIYRMKNAEYPGVIQQPDSSVAGVLYQDLSERDFRALDAFEGEQYQRRLVSVLKKDETSIDAWAYIVREEKQDDLLLATWTLSDFLEKDFDRFMTRFVKDRRDLYIQD